MSKHKYTSHKYKRKLEVKNGLKTCKSPGPDGLNPRCTSITLLLHDLANIVQCIRKVTSHESQSGSRKFNLREPLFCYGSHI